MSEPQPYYVGRGGLLPSKDRYDGDPRGILWMWEPPSKRQSYVLGVDPSGGIPMWNRHARRESDAKTDNGCIEVIRQGLGAEIPDRQVAEFAAPIDPEDLAEVVNVLGRVYGGNNDEGQARVIIEIQPGPGLLTQRKIIEYGYTNLFQWSYLDGITRSVTKSFGWTSTPRSQRDLWLRACRHMVHGLIELNSPWLIEEMADAEMDMSKMRARSAYGHHDDRLMAIMLAIWCAREWSLEVETVSQEVRTSHEVVNPQATDWTYDRMMEEWEEQFLSMGE